MVVAKDDVDLMKRSDPFAHSFAHPALKLAEPAGKWKVHEKQRAVQMEAVEFFCDAGMHLNVAKLLEARAAKQAVQALPS